MILAFCLLAGCGKAPEQGSPRTAASESESKKTEARVEEAASTAGTASASAAKAAASAKAASAADGADPETAASAAGRTSAGEDKKTEGPRMLKYIDAWQEWHTMEVDPAVRETAYDADCFVPAKENPQWLVYAGKGEEQSEEYECLQGIDVSEHQGTIDWQAVAEAGYRFAFIRVGYRGYGEAGNLFEDYTAVENLKQAKAAGLQVGTYFFSQALSEEEAAEEAALAVSVIDKSGVETDLPLMYDPEIIKDDQGRANEITREQVALNTAAFCRTAEASSCKVDIYSNLPWEHNYFDTDTMNAYEIWYADYEPLPQTPYHFTWWQYTNEGTVPGIEGLVDLDLWIRQK